MPLLVQNLLWMTYNSVLAYIPVALGRHMVKEKKTIQRLLYGIIWLLFIPNTIYMFTDIIHLFEDLAVITSPLELVLDIFLYILLMVISVLTFIFALAPFERVLMQVKIKSRERVSIIILLNFIIAFGVVLGRVQRLNSWDVFINLPAVIKNAIHTLTTIELLIFTLLFGLLGNCLYFAFRRMKASQKYI